MKHFKFILMILSLVSLLPMEIAGQTIKRNADGQKLIKRITSDVFQIDGTVDPGNFNDTYDMTYFPDGRLKSITISSQEFNGHGRIAECISIDADTFNIVCLKNGRKDSSHSAIVKFYSGKRHGLEYRTIKSITRKTDERDQYSDYIHRFCDIFFHSRYRTIKVQLTGSYDNINDLLSNVDDNSERIFTHDCNRSFNKIYPNTSFKDAGFKREICMLEDEDGRIFSHYDTKELLRQEQDGNLLFNAAEYNSRYLGDIFTERINDTNLNLQFFFEIGMPELMTEWVPVRSKNLIKYERGERYNQEIRYKKYWEYEYDSSGNLIGATVIRTDVAPKSKYRIKIEYVCE